MLIQNCQKVATTFSLRIFFFSILTMYNKIFHHFGTVGHAHCLWEKGIEYVTQIIQTNKTLFDMFWCFDTKRIIKVRKL